MKQFFIALQFLTILPIKISGVKQEDFGKSLSYFPAVGALIGLLLVLVLIIFNFLPLPVLAAIILISSVIITGGIHLDGFADTCDGFYGNRPKEEILRIMRDSHIGAMGVIGIALLLLLKFSILIVVPRQDLWRLLIMMVVFSRWAQSLACLVCSYANENGKGKYFVEYADKKGIVLGGLFTLTLFLLLAGLKGLVLFLVSLSLIFLFIKYVKKKIGGMTGDTIGATSEIAEALILLFSLF